MKKGANLFGPDATGTGQSQCKIQHTYPRGIHSFISELSGSQIRLEWDCVAKMVMPGKFTGQEKTINVCPMR